MTDANQDDFWSIDDDSPIEKPKGVFAVNEVRSCRELFEMIKDGSLKTSPKFQRFSVWDEKEQTRFIDSLAKQLPIPSLCISNSGGAFFQAIDGQQRLNAIYKFLDIDNEWKLPFLQDIDIELSGKTNKEICESNKDLFNKIRNVTIPVSMVMCDIENKDHLEYIFKIFHRLNSTAVILNNQEIRNCIYSGKLNDLINKLGTSKDFVDIKKINERNVLRLEGAETILAFFAFYDNLPDYQGKLTSFLNQYMIRNKNASETWLDEKEQIFYRSINILKKIDSYKTTNSTFNPVLYGIAKNIDLLESRDALLIKECYSNIVSSQPFSSEALIGGTWSKQKVLERYNTAFERFSNA